MSLFAGIKPNLGRQLPFLIFILCFNDLLQKFPNQVSHYISFGQKRVFLHLITTRIQSIVVFFLPWFGKVNINTFNSSLQSNTTIEFLKWQIRRNSEWPLLALPSVACSRLHDERSSAGCCGNLLLHISSGTTCSRQTASLPCALMSKSCSPDIPINQ